MSPDKTVLPLVQEVMAALAPHYRMAVRPLFTNNTFQGSDWFMCYVTYGIGDIALTLSTFHHIYPYRNETRQLAMIQQATQNGFLQTEDNHVYTLTDTGRQGVITFFTNARQALNAIAPLPESDLARLATLLNLVVTSTQAAPDPAEKFNLRLSQATAPRSDEPAMSQIDQFVTDLIAYQDDAHLATWRSLNITGQAWEALTYIWRGDAYTAAALAERLPNRNYDEITYEAALKMLVSHGWLVKEDGVYKITSAGQALRDEAEAATERNFLVGWSVLTSDEAVELKNLLEQFKDGLRQLTADEATAVFSDLSLVIGSASQAMFTLTRSGVNPIIEAAELNKPGLVFLLLTASVFDQPVTVATMRQRSPYSAPARYHDLFATLAELGLMTGDAGGYILTENGRSLVNQILQAFHEQLGTLQPTLLDDMPIEEWNRLADLLEQLDDACLNNAGDPPGNWCIAHMQGLPMPDEPCPLDRIDKVLDDLNAFRDDTHIAAFKPYKTEGHTWELFTALWREEVTNPAEMAEKYANRGYAETDYQQALLDLVKRGWVEKNGDEGYVVTENGRSLREEAETQTDIYYYLPWSAILPDAEELHTLLNKTDAALKKAVETSTEAVPV